MLASEDITNCHKNLENFSQQPTQNRKYFTVFEEIWRHPGLCPSAKCLWSEINTLGDNEYGGCYASIDYLANFMQVGRPRIFQLLKKLKDCGLLQTFKVNDGRIIRKTIWPSEAKKTEKVKECVDKKLSILAKATLSDSIIYYTRPVYSIIPPTYIENIALEEREETSSALRPSPLSVVYKKFGEFVTLTEQSYEGFCKKYTKPFVDYVIGRMNTFLKKKGETYRDYAKRLKEWLKNEKTLPSKAKDANVDVARMSDNIELRDRRRASLQTFKEKHWNKIQIIGRFSIGIDVVEIGKRIINILSPTYKNDLQLALREVGLIT